MKKITGPRITEAAEAALGRNFRNVGQGASYILDAFPGLHQGTLHREIKGLFAREDLLLLLDAMNGVLLSPQIAGQQIAINTRDAIALGKLDEKWGADGPALLSRLEELTIFQAHTLEVWCRGFWESGATSPEEWVAELE